MDTRIDTEKAARRKRTAEEILDAMKASGLSRKEFAMKMGRQPSEVTKWLSGTHNFTSDLLAEISLVLGCPISGAEDKIYARQCVDGYAAPDSDNVVQEPEYTLRNIDLPEETVTVLISKAGNAGLSLREYVRQLLCRKAAEKSVSAHDFCGIWSEECPDIDEIRSFRQHNTIKEL
ncbi:MAG: multiprotein-bridging factor 1 family protein [Candidatus Cryptobacteroides sp.]